MAHGGQRKDHSVWWKMREIQLGSSRSLGRVVKYVLGRERWLMLSICRSATGRRLTIVLDSPPYLGNLLFNKIDIKFDTLGNKGLKTIYRHSVLNDFAVVERSLHLNSNINLLLVTLAVS